MRDIKFMLGIDLGLYWKVCWAFIVPGSLSFFFIYYITRFPVVAYAGVPLPQAAVCEYKQKDHTLSGLWSVSQYPHVFHSNKSNIAWTSIVTAFSLHSKIEISSNSCANWCFYLLVRTFQYVVSYITDGGWIIFGLALSQVFIWGCHTVCMNRSFTMPQVVFF